MSTNKTENYGLHAWVAGDDFLREEMNENFAAIDSWLGEKAEVVIGSYTGTGKEIQYIELGFRPKALIVSDYTGFLIRESGGFFTQMNEYIHHSLKFTDTGFQVDGTVNGFIMNIPTYSPYVYLAVR